ncbi:Ig-like domain-containing protein [Ruania alba]|uniref:Ig-like domain-containing protein n=1 Tax=Ruania alba TaxID=648782 RepID=UPI001113EBDE|nr:Ig-like domain-containing protein [Ruania alba]
MTGTAEPGATVTVRGDGAAVGVATADEQGSWAVVPDAPAETFTATQEVSESGEFAGSSPASEPAGPFEYDEPVWSAALRDSSRILEDLDGDGVQAELPIEFRGERDAQARVLIDGEDVGGTMIATPGQTQRYVPNLDPGSYELGIHYADPETDAVGPTVTTTVTAVEPD